MSQETTSWHKFQPTGEIDGVLREMGEAVARRMVPQIAASTESFFNRLDEFNITVSDEKKYKVLLEIAVFFLHFADRMAFQYLGPDRRNIFVDSLFSHLKDFLSSAFKTGNEIESLQVILTLMYNERQKEYGQYSKLFPDDGENFTNTLLWEYGKKIAIQLGLGSDMRIILNAQMVFPSLIDLNLLELFTKNSASGLTTLKS